MPKAKEKLSSLSPHARRNRWKRALETPEEREKRLADGCRRAAQRRLTETPEEREKRLIVNRDAARLRRATETKAQREKRKLHESKIKAARRAAETPEQRERRTIGSRFRFAVRQSAKTGENLNHQLVQTHIRNIILSKIDRCDKQREKLVQFLSEFDNDNHELVNVVNVNDYLKKMKNELESNNHCESSNDMYDMEEDPIKDDEGSDEEMVDAHQSKMQIALESLHREVAEEEIPDTVLTTQVVIKEECPQIDEDCI